MKIFSIETSCDETAGAVISKGPKENFVKVLSNVVASSLVLHSKTGGIVPEIAAREQLKFIVPVIEKTIENSKLKIENLDAIAVTVGPGLIGSLLVGVETAKTLAYLWNKPIIPVDHLLGHIYANWIKVSREGKVSNVSNGEPEAPFDTSDAFDTFSIPQFPCMALLVSGGHTDLILLESHKKTTWIGGTLDDAAGEAFDKIGRLLNFPYPAGPAIEKASIKGIPNSFTFPRPMIGSKDFNFSFSGLKAAVLREVLRLGHLNKQQVADISLATQKAIIEVLARKTLKAAEKYNVASILLGGGVAANQVLRKTLEQKTKDQMPTTKLFCPPKSLCTDNAAMIGAYAAFHYKPLDWKKVTADPELYFE